MLDFVWLKLFGMGSEGYYIEYHECYYFESCNAIMYVLLISSNCINECPIGCFGHYKNMNGFGW